VFAVSREQPLQVGGLFATPGELRRQDVFQRLLGVDAVAVDRQTRSFARKPLVGLGQAQFGADDVQQVLGIAAVQDGERWFQPGGGGIQPQQAGGDGVKRTAPNRLNVRTATAVAAVAMQLPQQPVHAAQHLRGGSASERQQQNSPGSDALLDLMGDAVDQGFGLSRAGSGDDQQGTIAILDRLPLFAVQTFQNQASVLCRRHRHSPLPKPASSIRSVTKARLRVYLASADLEREGASRFCRSSFNLDPTGSEALTRSPLGRG
jgi:hypothetical protein